MFGENTEILMYDGTIKHIQDIKVGDILMGDDSTPRNVLIITEGNERLFRISMISSSEKDDYVVSEHHIMSLKSNRDHNKTYSTNTIHDISVADYQNLNKTVRGLLQGYRVPVVFPYTTLPVDAYVVGYLCSLGYMNSNDFYSTGNFVSNTMCREIYEYMNSVANMGQREVEEYSYYPVDFSLDPYLEKKTREFRTNASIPHIYKCSEHDGRMKLLAGILDGQLLTRKYINHYELIVYDTDGTLSYDIIRLARSLGFGAGIPWWVRAQTGYKHKVCIHVYGENIDTIPVIRSYYMGKDKSDAKIPRAGLKYRFRLTPMDAGDCYGLEVDGNKRIILGDYTVCRGLPPPYDPPPAPKFVDKGGVLRQSRI